MAYDSARVPFILVLGSLMCRCTTETVEMEEQNPTTAAAAFALIYFTFFLDNVLLTVLVPIIPDWVRGPEALQQWALQPAPLAALLNSTVQVDDQPEGGIGRAQATVGLILGSKAAVQLLSAGPAAAAVCRRGPAPVLRAATALLAAAAAVFWACSVLSTWLGGWVAAGVGAGRAVHGAGAAAAAVAGLAAAATLPQPGGSKLPALLGAVALGVLVGYPFGGVAAALWRPGTPFLLVAAALLVNLGLQYIYLDVKEFNMPAESSAGAPSRWGVGALAGAARRGAAGACAGAVLLTTSVMAALEPVLPLWLADRYGAAQWQTGLAFIPDSAGYFLATSLLGGVARRLGPERVALTGQITVGVAAMCVPLAASAWALAGAQLALGGGLGAVDAALVPALLARAAPRTAAARAALLQAASSAAYALGPLAGGAAAWLAGVRAALAALGLCNLLYATLLYRALAAHPLSEQWGANAETDSDDEEAQLAPLQYAPLRETSLR